MRLVIELSPGASWNAIVPTTIDRHTLSCIFGVSAWEVASAGLRRGTFQDCAVLSCFFRLAARELLLLLLRLTPEAPEPTRLLSISGKSCGSGGSRSGELWSG